MQEMVATLVDNEERMIGIMEEKFSAREPEGQQGSKKEGVNSKRTGS